MRHSTPLTPNYAVNALDKCPTQHPQSARFPNSSPLHPLLHRRMTEQKGHALPIMRPSTSLRQPILNPSVSIHASSTNMQHEKCRENHVGETSISSNLGLCFRFSENGTVFVATTLLRAAQSLSVLRAFPEKMPCVTRATISEAPCSRRVSAALARVPQVSGRWMRRSAW